MYNLEQIHSIQNPYVREVRELCRKARARAKAGCFIVEGERLLREVPEKDLVRVFVTKDYKGTLPERVRNGGDARLFLLSSSIMEAMSDTRTSQGVLAVVRMGEPKPRRGDFFLLLETLQDPGNLGTIFRTAEAAGVDGILMGGGCVDVYSPKVVRSTMGSIFRVPFWKVSDLPAAAEELRREGVVLYGSTLTAEADCYQFDFHLPTAFLIGNEGNGLSEALLSHADHTLRIPMRGRTSSLNAAMAATVLCYEAYRQRVSTKRSGIGF